MIMVYYECITWIILCLSFNNPSKACRLNQVFCLWRSYEWIQTHAIGFFLMRSIWERFALMQFPNWFERCLWPHWATPLSLSNGNQFDSPFIWLLDVSFLNKIRTRTLHNTCKSHRQWRLFLSNYFTRMSKYWSTRKKSVSLYAVHTMHILLVFSSIHSFIYKCKHTIFCSKVLDFQWNLFLT